MPMRPVLSAAVLAACALCACRPSAEPAAAHAETPAPTATPFSEPPPAAAPLTPAAPTPPAAATAAGVFDPASVAESRATLPPFPFFKTPDGLTSLLAPAEREIAFDREHMIAGDAVTAIEGKVFRDRFRLARNGGREYSAVEFQRNYADAIRALGGVEVSRVQFTHAVNAAFGGRDAVDAHYHGTCASHSCENHTYLIRQGGKEYWILVSTGALPLHGQVTAVERAGMTSSLGLLSAGEMKRAIDADGKVALQVNFDTDRATLRPDATPVIDEIGKLLRDDAALKLSIDGHTDDTGAAEHNRELSLRRAQSVRAALVAQGIAAERLQAQGYGPDRPVADNGNEQGRARNRRVELVRLQ